MLSFYLLDRQPTCQRWTSRLRAHAHAHAAWTRTRDTSMPARRFLHWWGCRFVRSFACSAPLPGKQNGAWM